MNPRHGRWLGAALAALAVANLALLAVALFRSAETIRDGAASVTNGAMVAGGIAITLLAVALAPLARFPRTVQRHAQVFALAAQVLHALGHLAGFYYALRSYDDVIHALLTGWAGLVALAVARGRKVIPDRQVTPARAALIVAFAGIALAGVWEIFEYGSDALFASREQDDLQDTMEDMIAGALGTLVAAAWAYRSLARAGRHLRSGRAPRRAHDE